MKKNVVKGWVAGLAAVGVSWVATGASADVAPPEDYVEKCTIANVQQEGEECIQRQSWFGDKGAAAAILKDYGFCTRCKTWGASTWGQIDCRKKDPAKPLPATWQADAATKEVELQKDNSGGNKERPTLPACALPANETKPSKDSKDGDSKSDSPTTKKPKTGCGCAIEESRATGAPFGLALLGIVGLVARRSRKSR